MCNGALGCHPRILRRILEDIDDQYVVAQCLQKWFQNHDNVDGRCSSLEGNDDQAKCSKDPEEDKQALLDMSKKIDFAAFSSYQLSQIKPSSLYSMERIFNAFVHNGSMDGGNGAVPPSPTSVKSSSFVCVAGAGVEIINGVYDKITDSDYRKDAKYAGMDAVICMRNSENHGWTIQVSPKAGSAANFSALVLYKAPLSDSNERTDVPFNSWKVTDAGTGPSPYVAVILSVQGKSLELSRTGSSSSPQSGHTTGRRIIRARDPR